jgi:hypothetical protein
MNICICGDGEHGKDTVARLIEKHSGLRWANSSWIALEVFLFKELSEKHGYKTIQEAYDNRRENRKEWYEAIQRYNTPDKTRLAREVMKRGEVYVGMRDIDELTACVEESVFDLVLGVFDPRKPRESHSNVVSALDHSDYFIINDKGLEELEIATIDFLKSIHQLKK